jgi:uncharacterized repeat protein (TIGR01451 family)
MRCILTPFRRLSLLLLSIAAAGNICAQGWYNVGWTYRKAITIDYTKVSSGPHTNFPVLISRTDTDLQAKAQSSGNDILFTASDGTTKLDHQIESYTSGTGALVAWVRIPSLSSSSNTVIYMYYGNASASDQQNATGTWESNFKAVWHLGETSTATDGMKDATSNANHGTAQGSPTGLGASAQIGSGMTLDGSNDYVSTKTSFANPQTLTLSLWFKTTSANSRKLLGFESSQTGTGSVNYDRHIWIGSDSKIRDGIYDGSSVQEVTTSGTYNNGSWHYAVLTFGSNTLKLYVNGSLIGSVSTTGAENTTGYFRLGSYKLSGWTSGSNGFFGGSLDEARVAFTVRSAGWILTEYNNQNSPSTFYSVGSELSLKTWDGGAGTNNWGDANNWNPDGVPAASSDVSLTGANTIDINVAAVCNSIVLNNANLILTVKSSKSLTASGNLTLSAGTLRTEAAFPTVSGTTDVSGGTVEYCATSGTQSVAVKSYNNLTISGGGTKTLAGTITPSGNLTIADGTLDLSTFTCNRSSAGGTLTVSNGAVLKIAGTGTVPSNYTTHSFGPTSTVEYAGTTQSVAVLNSTQNYGNLTISASGTKTLAGNQGVAGNLTIAAGTLVLGSYTLNRTSAGGMLTLSNGATLKIGGTNALPANYSTHAIGASSTIEFNGTNQTVGALNSSQNYGNLTLSGSGTKNLGASCTVAGNFSLSGASFADGGFTLSVNGNVVNSTNHTGAGKIALTAGSSAHTISGGGSFANLQMNDVNGATLAANVTINGTLTLTSGNISTASYSLIISSSGTVSRTSGHIIGNLQKYTATGATSKTFEIGTGSDYTPVTVAFGNVSVAGNLTASSSVGDHANVSSCAIDETHSVNRTWTLTNSGISFTNYSATFTFVDGDVDAGATTSAFIVGRYSAGWSYPTVGTKTSTSTQVTGLTAFGDFQIGEPDLTSTQSGTSVSSLTWSHTVSTQNNRILVVGVQSEHSSTVHPTGVTFNGTALTQIGTASAGTSTYQNVSLWYLLAPAASTANVVVTWSSAVNNATAGAITLYGLAQVGPEATATGFNNAGATSTNITTLADNAVVVDMFGSGQNQGDLAPGSGQAQRFINAAGATTSGGASTKTVPTAGLTSMTWTQTGINRSAHVVASFAPAVFYSKGNLAVNTASNWNTRRNGAGTNAPSFGTGARWVVQSGHSMTLSGSSTWDVSSSGTVEIESGGTWTNTSSGAITIGTLQLDNGGTYVHGSTASLPGTTKSFSATSTVNYNGSSQTVQALTYGNLTISSSGTKTLGGNVSVTADLSITGGTLDLSSYTANRSALGGTLTVSNGATLKIGGTNTFPSNYSTRSLGATATVEYGGTNQSISAETYGHLTLSGSGTKSPADDVTINGNLTIGNGTTFDAAGNTYTIQGNFTNSGTFSAGTSNVQFTGSTDAAITGVTTFHTLMLNKSAASNTLSLGNDVSASVLALTQGKVLTGANTITVTSDRTGAGLVIGRITRTHEFHSDVAYAFEGPDNIITFANGGTLPTSVTVTTTLSSPGANSSMDPISRYYELSQTGGAGFTFTLRLHYEDSEVSSPNSETAPPLKIWRRVSTGPDVWVREGATSNNTTTNWIEQTGLTTFGTFSLSSSTIANISLVLEADQQNPSPGDQITYTLAYTNDGDGTSTNTLFTASVPLNTTYVTGTTTVNGVPKTDANDADEVTVSGSTITINLGTVAAGASGTIRYKVAVN